MNSQKKISQNFYDSSYFDKGIESKKSCYTNYKWLPDLTIPMAYQIIKYLGLTESKSVLDFGCSKGYLVKAFRKLNINAYGVDVSEYAISNCDTEVKRYCKLLSKKCYFPFKRKFDFIISKDVLEHLTEAQIKFFLNNYKKKTNHMFHVVPLGDNGKFRIKEYHLDKSHLQMNDEKWWFNIFNSCGWKVEKFEYNVRGIKENWIINHKKGNGFFLLKKK
jgi:SAM-dependent methyltransferase